MQVWLGGFLVSAFGFRDHDFLKLRLYAHHEDKFKFIGLRQSFRDEAEMQHPRPQRADTDAGLARQPPVGRCRERGQ